MAEGIKASTEEVDEHGGDAVRSSEIGDGMPAILAETGKFGAPWRRSCQRRRLNCQWRRRLFWRGWGSSGNGEDGVGDSGGGRGDDGVDSGDRGGIGRGRGADGRDRGFDIGLRRKQNESDGDSFLELGVAPWFVCPM